MSLLRFVARSLFAGYFISEGVKAVTKPAQYAPDAERVTNTLTPLVQRVVPTDVSSYVPEKAETWVRVIGASQILGGAMFATGLGRRLGALILAKTTALNVALAWPEKDAPADLKHAARSEALRNGALLGAAVLGSLDTQGKPSMSWRAAQAAKVSGKKTAELSKKKDLKKKPAAVTA